MEYHPNYELHLFESHEEMPEVVEIFKSFANVMLENNKSVIRKLSFIFC